MKSTVEFLAKIVGWGCSLSGIWVYVKSIYMPFKDGSFAKMMCMICLPPFAQIYFFIAEWVKNGFLNEYGIACLIFILLGVMCSLLLALGAICWPEEEDSRMAWRILSATCVVVLLLLASYGVFGLVCSKIEVKNITTEKNPHTSITRVLGVRFGDTPDASFKFINGNSTYEIYEFMPEKRFRDYDHFVVVVSKKTKLIHTIRAQKDFKDVADAEQEVRFLKAILEEKYKVRFMKANEDSWIAKNGESEDDMQILTIATGKDVTASSIVVFSVIDSYSAKKAMQEIGVTKESFEADKNAL